MSFTPMLTLLEEDRHWWFAGRTRALLGLLDRYVGPGNERQVLDVGAGAGNMMHHLAHYGRVTGVDNNPRPIAVARERGYDVRLGDARKLPFEDARFDLVTLLDTVEHCPDDAAVLRECFRVTRPGGHLLVTVPAFMGLWSHNDVLNRHQRRYTAGELCARLREAGYTPRYVSYNNFLVFPLAAAMILVRRWVGRRPDLASPHFDDDAYQVEMEPTPPLLNAILTGVGQLEAALLRQMTLPIGTSIIALAQRPDGR
jgi:SAM-dependent methyltransferase